LIRSFIPNTPARTYLFRLVSRMVLSACLLLGSAVIAPAQQPADTASNTPNAKPKKVWTNDDFTPASANVAPATKEASLPARPANEANTQLATQLRGKLERLQAQWKDADQQLEELKRFQAGESSGDAGRQLHKRYSTEPIPEQIAKLEEKRNHLQDQIEAIYEEARKKGILPGELRSH
jgi:TolA-binding protein